jgi:hypothetical protein
MGELRVFDPATAAAVAPAQLHDLTHSPVGLWQFDNDLLDSSGNGFDLSLDVGIERYGPSAVPGATQALYCDGVSRFIGANPAPAALRILGSMTTEMLVFSIGKQDLASGRASIVSVEGPFASEAEADNKLWGTFVVTPPQALGSKWEETAGADQTHLSLATPPVGGHLIPNRWHHIAHTRDTSGGVGATIGRWYINGQLTDTLSTMDPPINGANARMYVGQAERGVLETFFGQVSSLKVIASVLTGPQILAEAQRTLPPDLRP